MNENTQSEPTTEDKPTPAFLAGQEAARLSRAEQGLPPTITVQIPR